MAIGLAMVGGGGDCHHIDSPQCCRVLLPWELADSGSGNLLRSGDRSKGLWLFIGTITLNHHLYFSSFNRYNQEPCWLSDNFATNASIFYWPQFPPPQVPLTTSCHHGNFGLPASRNKVPSPSLSHFEASSFPWVLINPVSACLPCPHPWLQWPPPLGVSVMLVVLPSHCLWEIVCPLDLM